MTVIDERDRLPLFRLCKAADMPRGQIASLVNRLGLPIAVDTETAEPYTSRSQFGAALRAAADRLPQ